MMNRSMDGYFDDDVQHSGRSTPVPVAPPPTPTLGHARMHVDVPQCTPRVHFFAVPPPVGATPVVMVPVQGAYALPNGHVPGMFNSGVSGHGQGHGPGTGERPVRGVLSPTAPVFEMGARRRGRDGGSSSGDASSGEVCLEERGHEEGEEGDRVGELKGPSLLMREGALMHPRYSRRVQSKSEPEPSLSGLRHGGALGGGDGDGDEDGDQ